MSKNKNEAENPVAGMTEETENTEQAATKKTSGSGPKAQCRFYLEHGYDRYFAEGEAIPANMDEKLLDVLKTQGVVA